jgi:hypothetical protein
MDSKFLEFWAGVLQAAARNQRILEDYAQWMKQGSAGSEAIADLFRQAYGLKADIPKSRADQAPFDLAMESFREGLREYFSLFGVVPQKEHLALKEKHEALKEKVREQEETIKYLKMLSESRQSGLEGVQTGFERLFEIQSKQYRELIKSLGRWPDGGKNEGDEG